MLKKNSPKIKIDPNYTHGDYLHEKYPSLRKYPKEIIEEPFFRMIGLRDGPSYKYLLVKTAREIERNIFSEYTDTRIANLCTMFKRAKIEDEQIIYDSIGCIIRAVEKKIKIPLIAEKGLYVLTKIACESNMEIKNMVQEHISSVLKDSAPGIRGMMIERLKSIDTVDEGDIKTIGSLELVKLDADEYESVQKQAKSKYVKFLVAMAWMQKADEEEQQRNKRACAMGPILFSELMGVKPESLSEALILVSNMNKNELLKLKLRKEAGCAEGNAGNVEEASPLPKIMLSKTFAGQLNAAGTPQFSALRPELGKTDVEDGNADEFRTQVEEMLPVTDSMLSGMPGPGKNEKEIGQVDSGTIESDGELQVTNSMIIMPEPAARQQSRIIEPIRDGNIDEGEIEPAEPPEIESATAPATNRSDGMGFQTQLDKEIPLTGQEASGMTDIEFLDSGIIEMEQDEDPPVTDSMVIEMPQEVHLLVKPKPKTDLKMPLVEDELELVVEPDGECPDEPFIENASAPRLLGRESQKTIDRPADPMLLRRISEPEGEMEDECTDSMVVSIEELKKNHEEVIFASRLSEYFGSIGTIPGSQEEVIFASRFKEAGLEGVPQAESRDETGYSHSKIFAIFSAPGENIIENGNGFESLIQEDPSDREQTNMFRRRKTSVRTQDGMEVPLEMISKSVKGGEVQFAYGNLENMPQDIQEMFPANSTRWVLDCDLDYPAHIQPIGSMDFGGKNVNVFNVPVPGSKSLTSINRRVDFTKDGKIISVRQIGSINSEDSILELLTDTIIKKE